MDKSLVRKKVLEKRNSLPAEDRRRYSEYITDSLLKLPAILEADVVLSYAPYGSEVDISGIKHKNMYLPVVTDATVSRMEFYKVNEETHLKSGYKGIMEPVGNVCFEPVGFVGKIAVILPGVAFDRKGNRIGYGKGFYDKYLTRLKENNCKVTKIAVAFNVQLLDEITADIHDIPYDYLVSENAVY